MVPSDIDIDRAIGEAIGLHLHEGQRCITGETVLLCGEGKQSRLWHPCLTRDQLPEVWAKVEKAGYVHLYFQELSDLISPVNLGPLTEDFGEAWGAMLADPRLQVTAALLALDKWPADWQIPSPADTK